MKTNKDNFGAICIGLLLLLVLSSCMTNHKGQLTEKGINFIALHCKGNDSTHISDNTVVTFDTVKIPYPVKGETIYLESPCDSLGKLKPVNITTKKNGIKTSVRSIGGSLAVDCGTDSLLYIIETQKRVINQFEGSKIVIKEPCDKEHIGRIQSFWIVTGMALLGFILFQIAIRILSTYPVLNWLKILYVFKF